MGENDFLYQVILPPYQLYYNHDISCWVYDLQGNTVFVTKKALRDFLGTETLGELNYPINFVTPHAKMIEAVAQKHHISQTIVSESMSSFGELVSRCYREQRLIAALGVYASDSKIRLSKDVLIPLLNQNGELIACADWELPISKVCLFNILNFIKKSEADHQLDLNQLTVVNADPLLTIRQLEVLFLLCHQFSEYQIAEVLNISRSTVKNIINNAIAVKFASFSDRGKLVQIARQYGYHHKMPATLVKIGYFELNG